jgi:hypothetical protein
MLTLSRGRSGDVKKYQHFAIGPGNNSVVVEVASLKFYLGSIGIYQGVPLQGSLGEDQDRGHRRCECLD